MCDFLQTNKEIKVKLKMSSDKQDNEMKTTYGMMMVKGGVNFRICEMN